MYRRKRRETAVARLLAGKRGMSLPLKALMLLIIGALMVIVAILVFVRVWNAIFPDTVNKDTQQLAELVESMVQSDLPYEQRHFILQLEDNWVVGYDPKDTGGFTFQKALFNPIPSCIGKTCICRGRGATEACFFVDTDNKDVRLASDYTGHFQAYNRTRNVAEFANGIDVIAKQDITITPQAAPAPGGLGLGSVLASPLLDEYTAFVVNTQLLSSHRSTRTTGKDTKAIAPLILEKSTSPNGEIVILVLPENDYARGREFYLSRCSDERKTVCSGKTSFESVDSTSRTYCALDILDGSCRKAPIGYCVDGQRILEPCICGGVAVSSGICAADTVIQLFCDAITTCEDYCAFASRDKYCAGGEAVLCSRNPCDVEASCALTSSLGTTFCDSTDEQEEQTLTAVGNTMDALIQDAGQYARKSVRIKLEDGYIIGFDQGQQTVNVGPNGFNIPDAVSRPVNFCGPDAACICLFEGDDPQTCFPLSEATGFTVDLGSDYTATQLATPKLFPLPFSLPEKAVPSDPVRKEQREDVIMKLVDDLRYASHTPFDFLGRQQFLVQYRLSGDIEVTTGPQVTSTNDLNPDPDKRAALHLLIEKAVFGRTIYLTVLPASGQRAATRAFYVQACDASSDTSCLDSSDPNVPGRTGFTSYLLTDTEESYCAPKAGTNTCERKDLPACTDNLPIDAPCRCGSSLATYGYCAGEQWYAMDCKTVLGSCSQYCRGLTVPGSTWTERDVYFLRQNVCGVAPGGTNACPTPSIGALCSAPLP